MIITGNSQEIASAYIKARSEITTTMTKDAKANYGKYVTLAAIVEAVTPTLILHGLTLLQEPISNDLGVGVATTILHESGASIEFMPLIIPVADRKPHTVGSALSYARRYALNAILGLAADDDDGQAAQKSFAAPATNGTSYHDDELWDTPAQHSKKPDTISQAQLSKIHALGTKLHPGKGEWDAERPRYVEFVTKGAVSSAKELTPNEADALIVAMERKLSKLAAELQSAGENRKVVA